MRPNQNSLACRMVASTIQEKSGGFTAVIKFKAGSILCHGIVGVLLHAGAMSGESHAKVTLLRTIDNPAPGVQDNFGRNISTTNDGLILAGAQTDVGEVVNAGNAYLFNPDTGAIVYTMPNPEPESDVGYSAFSWSGDTRIIVSAFLKDDNSGSIQESGRVYVFDKATGQHTLTISNPTPGNVEQFGYGVGMLGDVAIIGSRGDDTAGTDTGIVYLIDAITGSIARTIPNPQPTGTDNFGYSVAGVGTDKILVGAPGAIVNGQAGAGMAYLLNADTGAVIHRLVNPYPSAYGFFGFQVRAFGEDLLIGSPNNNKAYLFDSDTGNLVFEFSRSNPQPGDVFGSTVAAAGDNILVGNPQPYPEHPKPGVAYLYSGSTGKLLQTIYNPTPEPEDRFGVSVAGSNGKIIVSGDQNKINDIVSAGSIYVFQAPPASVCCEWNLYQ